MVTGKPYHCGVPEKLNTLGFHVKFGSWACSNWGSSPLRFDVRKNITFVRDKPSTPFIHEKIICQMTGDVRCLSNFGLLVVSENLEWGLFVTTHWWGEWNQVQGTKDLTPGENCKIKQVTSVCEEPCGLSVRGVRRQSGELPVVCTRTQTTNFNDRQRCHTGSSCTFLC